MSASATVSSIVLLALSCCLAQAKDDVYLKPSTFLKQVLGNSPKAGAIALTSADQAKVKKLIGRTYKPSRIRYWTNGKRTAWILNEIGKTKPITTGYVVSGGKIEQVQVLVYRESHGWEVRQKFFTKQFKGAKLTGGRKLSKRIDNIAGATLSVRALTKMGKLALFLDGKRAGK